MRKHPLRLAFAVALGLAAAVAAAGEVERVDLVPEDPASFRARRIFSWLRPGHNFSERTIYVDTVPPGANLDLFYIRSNFQKRYEQAQAPALVLLPKRVEAGPRDAVTIRAFAEGYRQREVSVRVGSSTDRVEIELEALPNTLVGVSHSYFGGRASLGFLTREALQLRVQDVDEGFNVILAETARAPELAAQLERVSSPLVASVDARQLGEDLLLRVRRRAGAPDISLRSRQARDELRDLYVSSVEMVPPDGGVAAVRIAREALARIGPDAISGCAAHFDRSLREELDAAALARALAPRGAFTDPYVRAAMKRLGEVSPGGKVAMLDGARYDPRNPIELEAALSQAHQAQGFLALLRDFARRLEPEPDRNAALRSLVAPELDPQRFDTALEAAARAEGRCGGGADAAG